MVYLDSATILRKIDLAKNYNKDLKFESLDENPIQTREKSTEDHLTIYPIEIIG